MRAHRFDLDAVRIQLVEPMDADADAQREMLDWYGGIMVRMREQGIEEQGHLEEVEEVMNELEFLHRSLVDVLEDEDYSALVAQAEPGIVALQQGAGAKAQGPIATCFTAIYGVMLLKAQGRKVGKATLEAEGHMRRLLERLSAHYRQMRRLPGVSLN